MVNSLREQLERGWLQLYCIDSVDAESWYCWWAHAGGRAYRHHQYFEYIHNEVLPLMNQKNSNPFLITAGMSFGAFHAMSFGLKYPHRVDRILSIAGLYDIRRFTGGYSDDYVYFNNPTQFIAGENDGNRLAALRHLDIVMPVGNTDPLIQHSRDMSSLLWSKGIGNALREWDGWCHDWPYWYRMVPMYMFGNA